VSDPIRASNQLSHLEKREASKRLRSLRDGINRLLDDLNRDRLLPTRDQSVSEDSQPELFDDKTGERIFG